MLHALESQVLSTALSEYLTILVPGCLFWAKSLSLPFNSKDP